MKKSTTFIKSVLLSVLLGAGFTAGAQKLPNTQQESLRLPANIKIDGKAVEWNNQFRAYNKSTDIFYTIANDDDRLYLIIQATDPSIINKIIGGGITFTIQKTGKKDDKGGISITYPYFDKKSKPAFNLAYLYDNAATINKDSIIAVYNKTLESKSQQIKVTGIAGLDELISVYNQDGIKTAQLFDNKPAYTYELAVDLKQLGLSTGNPAKFAYHINLGASIADNLSRMRNFTVGADGETSHPAAAYTDFWGEYTLAGK